MLKFGQMWEFWNSYVQYVQRSTYTIIPCKGEANIDQGINRIYDSMTAFLFIFRWNMHKKPLLWTKIPVKLSFYFHYLSFKHNMSKSFVCVPCWPPVKRTAYPSRITLAYQRGDVVPVSHSAISPYSAYPSMPWSGRCLMLMYDNALGNSKPALSQWEPLEQKAGGRLILAGMGCYSDASVLAKL